MKHEQLMEQCEDTLFALMMETVSESEGQALLRLNEELFSASETLASEGAEMRIETVIRRSFSKSRVQKRVWKGKKILRNFTLAALVSTLMFTTVSACIDRFRIIVLNSVLEILDDHTQITFESSSQNLHDSETNYNISVEWLPNGYVLEGGVNSDASDLVTYVKSSRSNDSRSLIDIVVTPYSKDLIYHIDTEDSEKIEVMVQDIPAALYKKDESALAKRYGADSGIVSDMTLMWVDHSEENVKLIHATNLQENELLRIGNGVRWRKPAQ